MTPIIHTLSNGLRVIAARSDGHATYAGVLTGSGSRDDAPGKEGQAHFLEHTLFKGTTRRKSWQITDRLEKIGGFLNAYTSKESLMVYAVAPEGYEDRVLEVLSDIVRNPTFPDDELEKERHVVIEEINSYHDDASDAVFDEFDELFYSGHPLAHNILGDADTVTGLAGDDMRAFIERHFTPGNMIVYCVSPQDPQKLLRHMEKHFSPICRPDQPLRESLLPTCRHFDERRDRGNRQANTVLGLPAISATDPKAYALYTLNFLLGGGMNSRLNKELRENRGLVYTVDSSFQLYKECGSYQVYFATDPANVDKCTRIVEREITKLADKQLSESAFRNTVRQMTGMLLVSSDRRDRIASGFAKSLMRYGRIVDMKEKVERLNALNPTDLQQIAQHLISTPLSRLTLI